MFSGGIEKQDRVVMGLIHYKHHDTETFFIFTTFVSMSRPRSIYVVSM